MSVSGGFSSNTCKHNVIFFTLGLCVLRSVPFWLFEVAQIQLQLATSVDKFNLVWIAVTFFFLYFPKPLLVNLGSKR